VDLTVLISRAFLTAMSLLLFDVYYSEIARMFQRSEYSQMWQSQSRDAHVIQITSYFFNPDDDNANRTQRPRIQIVAKRLSGSFVQNLEGEEMKYCLDGE
jgi:hypothetical protein